MKSFILIIIGIFISCEPTEKQYSAEEIASESKRANEWFDKKFDEIASRNPMRLTFLGIKKDYDKWNDISDENRKKI